MIISFVELNSSSSQQFYITLNNVQYYLVISWSNAKIAPHYNMDIYYDSELTKPVACGIPLVSDWGLTNQLRYLGLKFGLVVSDPALGGEMKLGDLNTSHYLYIGVEDENDETVS